VAELSRDDLLRALIFRVRTGDAAAWSEFLDQYAPLILQAARAVERDHDSASDAFVFACERLRERRCARLATFDLARAGSFETWLRAVAINLARDARRQRVGRLRPFALARRFPPLEQRVFRLRYEVGLTFDQIMASLGPEFPGLTEARLAEADALVASRVSARQRWTLLTRRPRVEPLDSGSGGDAEGDYIPADAPNAEWIALARESHAALTSALRRLPPEDRLLVRLHVERGVTLAALAPTFGLANAQAVHRRLRGILQRLKQELTDM
jgi:DNA-directed RNA polymerase specialized sigma24 family protein